MGDELTNDLPLGKLIPSGWELDTEKDYYQDLDIDDTGLISIHIKKSKNKFINYVNEFSANKVKWPIVTDLILNNNFNNIDDKLKFGILEFICHELGLNYYDVLRSCFNSKLEYEFPILYEIIPTNFLKSIRGI